jgi:hypothetical protein
VGDRGVVDVDKVILAEVPKFDNFFRRYFRNRSDFNPLGEFVYGDQDMFLAAWSGTKRSYNVETPHSEGP